MSAVFAAQGWGNFTAALVALIITAAYKQKILKSDATLGDIDYMWRLLIGLGIVPAVVALYFRLTIPETPRFTMDVARNVEQATTDIDNVLTSGVSKYDGDAVVVRVDAPKASFKDFCNYFGKWRNFKILFGTSYSWFALDVCIFLLLHGLLSESLGRLLFTVSV